MNAARWLLMSMALAAITPLFATGHARSTAVDSALPDWPHEFDGRPLRQLPLTAEQQRFLGDFPGAVAHFSDGERDILMRWVNQPTRKLHPAEDCYRAWGFTVGAAHIRADRDGSQWRCFTVSRDGVTRQICEQIRDSEGAHFTDVSSWYWSATLQHTPAPWLVTTVSATANHP
jgi:hypothetical protein